MIFLGVQDSFKATRYHSLVVDETTLPKDFEIIAKTNDNTIMGISHNTFDIIGLQFHPESIGTKKGFKIIENFFETIMKKFLNKIIDGRDLSIEESFDVMNDLMSGNLDDVQISALLTALRCKGESVSEILGFAKSMRERMLKMPLQKMLLTYAEPEAIHQEHLIFLQQPVLLFLEQESRLLSMATGQ